MRDRWAHWLTERRDAGDDAQRKVSLDLLAGIRDRVLDQAGALDGATVLDVGCGDGLIGLAALERVGPDGAVIFSDISAELLELAERSVRDLGFADRATFVEAGADDLAGVADGSVDLATTRSVLIYVADKAAAFAAMHRVLRPGGRVSLFEPINSLMYPEPRDRLWGYDVGAVADLADRVKDTFERLSDPATASMSDFDDRDLVRHAVEARFREVHLTLNVDVAPGDMRAASFDSLVDGAPNPLAPTLRETIEQALDADEATRLLDHLRDRFDTTEPTQMWAGAFLTAWR
ncbi:MAG TPA: methyltransferase domain-containing protein [Solirubrobacteraceae bacterium]|nr:methyltransferase domain-containing protein [Solirubrobacteraceae bacterium]